MIARMRMNARLYELPPVKYPKGKREPKPPVGKRLLSMSKDPKGNLEPVLLGCTDFDLED